MPRADTTVKITGPASPSTALMETARGSELRTMRYAAVSSIDAEINRTPAMARVVS